MMIGGIPIGTNNRSMRTPLSPGVSPGYFSQMSLNNKEDDLAKIVDCKGGFRKDLKAFDLPSKALVINLPEREDRWMNFKIKNDNLFQKLNVERVNGIVEKFPPDGIFKSHLKCMKLAKKIGEPILVLEDDCELAQGWFEKIKKVFQELPADWDVLIGNHYFFSEIEILTEHLAKPRTQASTANFVIYNHSCHDAVVKNLHLRKELDLYDVDHLLTSEETSISNYTIWPMVAREFISISDHYKKIRNMEFRVREHSFQFQFVDSDIYYPSIECW